MIHIPGRTYYLEDSSGDQATAELWVQTISSLQARLAEVARESGAEPMSPINPARLAAMDSFRSVDEEMSVRRGSTADAASQRRSSEDDGEVDVD